MRKYVIQSNPSTPHKSKILIVINSIMNNSPAYLKLFLS